MTSIIRPATAADIPAILALERQCASAAHWTEFQYQRLFEQYSLEQGLLEQDVLRQDMRKPGQRLVLLLDENPAIGSPPGLVNSPLLGFLVAHNLGDDWELENIAVTPARRRSGLATRMLLELFRRAAEAGGKAVFLEVRESNESAKTLYRNLGFSLAGRRNNYYQKPLEDAILCRRALA